MQTMSANAHATQPLEVPMNESNTSITVEGDAWQSQMERCRSVVGQKALLECQSVRSVQA